MNASKLIRMYEQGYRMLENEKETINAMNVFPVPDGDTGTNMSLTFKNVMDMLSTKKPDNLEEISQIVTKAALMGARGNSGVILSQILGGFSKSIASKQSLGIIDFKEAFKSATELAYKSVVTPVEGTLLTVVRESAEAVQDYDNDGDFEGFFNLLLYEAKKSLDNTPKKLSVLAKAGVVDAGGRGLVSIYTGFYNMIIGKELDSPHEMDKLASFEQFHDDHTEINFTYCTECILNHLKKEVAPFKDFLLENGDSLVFVQSDDLLKVHVHTDHPGKVLEQALDYGDLYTIKIENMREQNLALSKPAVEEELEYALLAIATGDGFNEIFTDLGCHKVILGGQTMNPSTQDILDAMDKVKAKKYIILPNNSNIIMAANQAKNISEQETLVIPSKTMAEGISAILQFDPSLSLEENEENMTQALDDVDTVQITYAVRDTEIDDKKIKKNEFISLFNGKIVDSDKKIHRLLKRELEKYAMDYDLMTIYYGDEADIIETEKVVNDLRKTFDDVDFEMYHGGQPVYSYIISLE